jgi:hypothetical protein
VELPIILFARSSAAPICRRCPGVALFSMATASLAFDAPPSRLKESIY